MKKLIVLMLSFLLLSLFFAACGDMVNITVPHDTSSSDIIRGDNNNKITWTGQGMDSLALECGEDGYIQWVLNQAKDVTSAKLFLEGFVSESYTPVNITPGGIYYFNTPYYDLEDLEAYILYEGEIKKNTSLLIEEYCPGEDSGEAVPISIVLSWGAYEGSSISYAVDFQTRLITPENTENNIIYGEATGENNSVTTVVDTFIPGTYYYLVKTMSTSGNVTYGDMSSCVVNVFDTTTNSLLATFDVSNASVVSEWEEYYLTWKVFTFDGSTGEITTVNELNLEYATPW